MNTPTFGPNARFGVPDLRMLLGTHMGEIFVREIESLGMIRYRYVLRVLNAEGQAVLFVTAETNPFEGPDVIFLGLFSGDRHVTLARSTALKHPAAFVATAMHEARGVLGMNSETTPPTSG